MNRSNPSTTMDSELDFDPVAAEVSAVYRKIAWRLLPFLVFLFVLAWIDRVNVGFAKLSMLQDLGFSEAVYGLGAGIFFIGYFFFEVPSNLLLEKIGARRTLFRDCRRSRRAAGRFHHESHGGGRQSGQLAMAVYP